MAHTIHTPKILLVDDHAMFNQGLVSLLKDDYEVTVAISAAEMRSCLEQTKDFALVLLDLYLADGKSSLELVPELRSAKLKFFILSGTATREDQRAFVELGARGFLSKTAKFEVLLPAIRGVTSGYQAFPDGLIENLRQRHDDEVPHLTPREITILDQLFPNPDKQNDDIADALHVTPARIKKCLTALFCKFGVKGRHSLVTEAKRRGYYPQRRVCPHHPVEIC